MYSRRNRGPVEAITVIRVNHAEHARGRRQMNKKLIRVQEGCGRGHVATEKDQRVSTVSSAVNLQIPSNVFILEEMSDCQRLRNEHLPRRFVF